MWFERRYWQNNECDSEFRRSKDYQEGNVCMLKPPVVNEVKVVNDKDKEKKEEKKWVNWCKNNLGMMRKQRLILIASKAYFNFSI